MKASEIILDSFIFQNTNRGQATELLCDLVTMRFGGDLEMVSNGQVIDTILMLLDIISVDDIYLKRGLMIDIERLKGE